MAKRPGNRDHIQKYPEQATSKLGRIGLDNSTLQALQDASSRALQTFADLPFYNKGIPTKIQQKDYKANIREAVRVDPTNGAFTVSLPEIKSNTVGGAVFVVNITSDDSTIVTVSPGGSDTIDGETSYPVVGAYNYAMFWAAEEGNWVVGRSIRIPGNVACGGIVFGTTGGVFGTLAAGNTAIAGDHTVLGDGYYSGTLDAYGDCYFDDNVEIGGDLDVTGTITGGGYSAQSYSTSNVSTDRSYDADSTDVAELADVLGTLIADLQALGLIG